MQIIHEYMLICKMFSDVVVELPVTLMSPKPAGEFCILQTASAS